MSVPADVRRTIENGQLDRIDDLWLQRLAEDPEDLDHFVGVARALTGVAEEERARMLLQMLDEALRDHELWRTRLDLLRRAGTLLFEPPDVHPAILETLQALHGDTPSFDELVKAVRLDKAPHDLEKAWKKVDRLRELVPYDVGAVVWMKGRGAGRVTEVNLELDSLKVEFPGHSNLSVGFRAAPKMLRPLPPGHVFRRKEEEPEALKELAESDPPELLRIVLTSFEKPLEASDVKEAVEGLVPPNRWTSWWAAARKHPQVMAHGKGRQTYSWLASEKHALEAVWERFEEAEPRSRIALLRKEGSRDRDLARRMAEALAGSARDAAEADPALAFEIALGLESESSVPEGAAGEGIPAPEELVTSAAEPKRLLTGIEDRAAKERAYRLVRELRDDWVEVYGAQLGREEDAKVLDLLADALAETAPKELQRFAEAVVGQPHKNPAGFTWLAERAAGDPELRRRNPLRLMEQIFTSMVDRRFAPYKMRLARLVESGGTVPRLLDHLEERHAERAETAIHKAAALESYQRDALTNALHLRFPELRGEGESELIYSTPEAIEARRRELEALVKEEIPANRKAIEEARALGDLRENFEYKSARQRHEYLSARQAQLERELTVARPIEADKIDPSEVRIGTRVELTPKDGGAAPRTITILGPWDSKPEEDVLAYESDLAQALLGKRPGEPVEAGGTEYEVGAIRRYTE